VVLSVTDSGHGIESALRDRVFEPFFTTKPLGKGTGLGLSTVYGILRQSGGGVHVRSKPGKGSMFKVYFPLCGEAVREKAQAPLAPPPAGLETVLLAEDEGAVRTLLHEHLQELGYRVLEAANGTQALEIARQHINEIDIVVTDVVMPKMGGRELAAQLRLLRPEIKIVLMTGYTEAAVCDELRAAGLELLAKPFSRRALAGKLREMLDSRQPARPPAAEPLPISENRIV
jgi:CheY-like chemotaxis protein